MTDQTPIDDGLSAEERALLARARRDLEPALDVLERTVGVLRQRELLAPRARMLSARLVLQSLAAAAVFALGVWAGRTTPPVPASGPRYLLLLYSDAEFSEGTPEQARQRVVEYGDWARALARKDLLIAGEELADGGTQVGRSGVSAALTPGALTDEPRGYFVITARDEQDALRIAATCPHLRHGGRVILRRIAT